MTTREAITLAAAAALNEVDGVAGPAPGLHHATPVDGISVAGVVTAATARGGYDVTLYVTARPVPLAALGQRVMARVVDRVAEAGYGDDLGDVRVVVLDIVEPA
jgi:hypothetical protein